MCGQMGVAEQQCDHKRKINDELVITSMLQLVGSQRKSLGPHLPVKLTAELRIHWVSGEVAPGQLGAYKSLQLPSTV